MKAAEHAAALCAWLPQEQWVEVNSLDHCPLGGSAQVFTPLRVAFGSHLLCAEDSCLLRLQRGREGLAGWISSWGLPGKRIRSALRTPRVCAGFAVLLCEHRHWTSFSFFW